MPGLDRRDRSPSRRLAANVNDLFRAQSALLHDLYLAFLARQIFGFVTSTFCSQVTVATAWAQLGTSTWQAWIEEAHESREC